MTLIHGTNPHDGVTRILIHRDKVCILQKVPGSTFTVGGWRKMDNFFQFRGGGNEDGVANYYSKLNERGHTWTVTRISMKHYKTLLW